MKHLRLSFFLLFVSLLLTQCGFKKNLSTQDRISQFESVKLKTSEPVEVLWSKNLIPRIKAENSKDLFYTLGAVQVHLRRTQLEIYRKLSRGAMSEMSGPVSIKLDRFLKSIDFEHAAQISYYSMSKESLDVLDWMVAGMNDYIAQSKYRSIDLRILGIGDEKWTPLDLVRIIKFTSVDVNWMVLAQLLEFKNPSFLEQVWNFKTTEKDFFDEFLKTYKTHRKDPLEPTNVESTDQASALIKSLKVTQAQKPLDLSALDHMQLLTKAGSNAFAVNGSKTQSKSAIVSNDPHLGILIPNIWVFVILDSPEYKTMGYIIPSFPIPVIGRNMDISWGGTNLWGISTYPMKLKPEDASKVVGKEQSLAVRFWPDKTFKTYKLGAYPVLRAKDFPEIGTEDIVFRWQGYEASNELDTFLKVNRAKNFTDFHQAFESYGVAGMTFLYGDKQGNVGKIIATTQSQVKKLKLFYELEDFTGNSLNSLKLPKEYNPAQEFVVSANDYTKGLIQPLSLFQAPYDRRDRMTFVLKNKKEVTLDDVKELHKDVFSATAYELKNDLIKYVQLKNWIQPSDTDTFKILESWSGDYHTDSKGALAFEVFLAAWTEDIIQNFVLKEIESDKTKEQAFDFLTKNFNYRKFLSESLTETDFLTEEKFKSYFEKTKFALEKHKTWGEFHPLDLRHPLGNLKLFKYAFSFFNGPWEGGNETLAKAAHKLSTRTAKVSFGAQARWMTDLSSLNENYLVYLGGQDGFIGSENINDLTSKWQKGDYLKVPFEREEFKTISASKGQ